MPGFCSAGTDAPGSHARSPRSAQSRGYHNALHRDVGERRHVEGRTQLAE